MRETILNLIKDYPNPETLADHILELIKGIKAQVKSELMEKLPHKQTCGDCDPETFSDGQCPDCRSFNDCLAKCIKVMEE